MKSGSETLTINVMWVDGHRDSVEIFHAAVGGAPELVVAGRSMNDVMKTIASYFDYELDLTQDKAFVLKFQ